MMVAIYLERDIILPQNHSAYFHPALVAIVHVSCPVGAQRAALGELVVEMI